MTRVTCHKTLTIFRLTELFLGSKPSLQTQGEVTGPLELAAGDGLERLEAKQAARSYDRTCDVDLFVCLFVVGNVAMPDCSSVT